MNSLDYDIHIQQQADATWAISRAQGQTAIARAANLDEAIHLAADLAPGGDARVRRSSGKIAVLRLDRAAPKPQA